MAASTTLARAFWSAYADKLRKARGVDAREAPRPATTWRTAKPGREARQLRRREQNIAQERAVPSLFCFAANRGTVEPNAATMPPDYPTGPQTGHGKRKDQTA